MNQQTCNRAWLDAFLKNDLNQREEQMLTSHLDECSDCREELESRAAEESVWREASNLLCGSVQLLTAAIGDSRSSTVHSPQIALVLQQLAPTDDPESLGRIGGYEVTGVVGAGGMGVVLKAHDRSLDRIVAIKVMSPHLASSGSARKRFAREAKAAAAVLHPNVIAIHSVASEDANPYLVMPFVRGASLQKRIDSQGPLPLKDTLRIGAQIAAGLAAAHEQGLVHRDIKPANILLEEGVERVTITDFGLARAVDDASMTCSGVIAGTPQYMSPEQARGEPIDARSDLFSLGGVLYAMCTGRSPFRAETTYGVLHRIANDKPTPVCEVNTDVPVWLGHFIERLMAKRPEDRFESAAQIAEMLEGCLAHVQQPAAMPLPSNVEQLSQLLPVSSSASQQAKKQLGQLFYNLPPIGKFIAAAAGACALLFAGVLIVLELGKGTLTIESELDDVPIRIMQGDKVVEKMTVSKSGNSVRVAAGMYVVELDTKLDGIVVENESISLKRGDSEQIRIRYAKPLANSSEGSTPDKFSQSLQGEWEYVSVETDGVTTEYKTLEVQQRTPRLKVAGDRWTVPLEDGITVFGSGFRVEVDGNKLTFDMPGLGNEDLRSICYGLFEVDGDALTYLMTPAVAEGALNGQGQPPIEFPDSFETKGTKNTVYRLRRIQASTPPTPSSSTNQTQSKSSPEFPPVKILVHDEEGKPLEGVKVSLIQLAKDPGGQVLEINETSNANGLAVNRNLPYGHYELTATTADGWYLTGYRSRLNVEFEKGVDAILVAPTPGKTSKLVISSDIMTSPEKIRGLRFGQLREGNFIQIAPEPEGSNSNKEREFASFPTIANGIEYIGAEIGIEITRNISQPAPSMQHLNSRWTWTPAQNRQVLIANGQARNYDHESNERKSLERIPVEGSEFFKLPGPKYRVGASLLKLREPTELPVELDIPAGNVKVSIGRFLGKPSAAVMAALNWQPRDQQSELWLEAQIHYDSAWVERLINTEWLNSPFREGGAVAFPLLWREQVLQPGEQLEIPLRMKQEVDSQPEFPLIAWDFEYPLLGRRMAKLRVSKDLDLESVFPGRQTVKGKAPEAEVKDLIELIAQSASDDDGLRYQNTVSRIAEFDQLDTSVRTERVAVNREGRILELQLNKSIHLDIENRLWRLEGIVAIGGQDALTDLMAIANRQLQTQFPEITYKLTTRDFLFGIMLDSGTRIVYIRIPVNKSESTNRVEMNFTLTVPSVGEPKLEHIFDANSADDPPIETPALPKTLDKSTREMDSPKIYTAEELIANGMDLHKNQQPVTVRFKVASVRRNGVIDPDGKETQHWFLSSEEYKGGPDPKAFQVQVSMDAEKALERSGVKDIPAHFNGQELTIVGKVSTSGLRLPGRDTIWLYSITLERLDQLHFVNADGNSSLPKMAINETAAGLVEKIATESKATTLDHRNARSVVEAYVASALAGDVAKAASLAKNSPADPKRIRELPEFLNVQRLKIQTVYINDPAQPTQALATSVAVKLEEEHKNPDGRRDGFMVFTLEYTNDKWLVTDIDFESESGAEKELNEFLKANPKSIGIPPQSKSLSR